MSLVVRVGYIVVPPSSHFTNQQAPASKRPRVERATAVGRNASDAVHVTQIDDLAELRSALARFAETGEHDDSASPNVEVRRVKATMGGESDAAGGLIAFCFLPGVLDIVLGTSEEKAKTAQLTALVGALPETQRTRLCGAETANFPRFVRIAEDHGSIDGVVCAVVGQPVLKVSATAASIPAKAASLAKPILVVGAGGIGCELLKVLVLRGFMHVYLVDLDTIDATNLNRQFLFTHADVGQSKAETACAAVRRWFATEGRCHIPDDRPVPTLVPYHDNIKSEAYGVAFYSQFSAVLNALDNVSARQHVNRMCVRANVPLIESGTMGYNGQVQPILPSLSECYDCRPKPVDQKTFAVCTIHARPTTIVHCVHYAKELYTTLFASADEASQPSPSSASEKNSENPTTTPESGEHTGAAPAPVAGGELQYLRGMLQHWRGEVSNLSAHTPAMATTNGTERVLVPLLGFGQQLMECLYVHKVEALLAMKSTWSTTPPVPLEISAVHTAVHTAPFASLAEAHTFAARLTESTACPTVCEAIHLFLAAAAMCAVRLFSRGETVAFRKEDDAAVQFVAAAASLRAHVFHIEAQSVESLRSIAGAIVPAIATTNAMAGAGVVQQLERMLNHSTGGAMPARLSDAQMIYIRKTPQTRRRRLHQHSCLSGRVGVSAASHTAPQFTRDHYLVHSAALSAPASECKVCQRLVPSISITLNLHRHTLAELATDILGKRAGLESVCISQAASILYEEDFESLGSRLLASFLPDVSADQDEEAEAASQSQSSLLLVVDALNRDMEWEVELRHSNDAGVGVVVEGIEAAKAAEAEALRRREAQATRAAAELQVASETNAASGPGDTAVSGGASARDAVVLASDSDDEDVLEVEVGGETGGVVAAMVNERDSNVVDID